MARKPKADTPVYVLLDRQGMIRCTTTDFDKLGGLLDEGLFWGTGETAADAERHAQITLDRYNASQKSATIAKQTAWRG